MLILGNHCNPEKALCFTIQSVFGINNQKALNLCALVGVNPKVKLKHLQGQRLEKLKRICQDQLGLGLRREAKENVKQLIEIKHYKGVRHMFGLPCRGQATHTNASTARKCRIIKQNKSRNNPLWKRGSTKR